MKRLSWKDLLLAQGALFFLLQGAACTPPAREAEPGTPPLSPASSSPMQAQPAPAGTPPSPEKNRFAPAYPEWEAKITGADIKVPDDITELKVAPGEANDQAEGFLSLKQALQRAKELNREDQAVRVSLGPGAYRDIIRLEGKGADGLLIIEGDPHGGTILTGSEDWSGPARWTISDSNPRLLTAPWDKDWGDIDIAVQASRRDDRAPRLRGIPRDDAKVELAWASFSDRPNPVFRVYRQVYTIDKTTRYEGRTEKIRTEFELIYEGSKTSMVDENVVKSETWKKTHYDYRVTEALPGGGETGFSSTLRITPGDASDMSRPQSLGRRREMVFVDGERLRQVLTAEALEPGTYLVDDGFPSDPGDGRLTVYLPDGAEPGSSRIEVAVHHPDKTWGHLWQIVDKRNLVVRNLAVRHFPSYGMNGTAFMINRGDNVLVENCRFEWNNGVGLNVRETGRLTLRNLVANDNGASGLMFADGTNILVENVATHRNNWRGDWGKVYNWFYAGIKCGFGMRDVIIRHHEARNNQAHGLWIDYDVKRLIIDGLRSHDNLNNGLYVEALHGPTVIRHGIMTGNKAGVHLANSEQGVLHDNRLIGNHWEQLNLLPRLDRPVEDTDAGADGFVPRNLKHWTWTDNVFVSTSFDQRLIGMPIYDFLFNTLTSDRNLFYHPQPEQAFKLDQMLCGLFSWRKITGQDRHSRFADPMLDASYKPLPGSPLLDRDAWPEVDVEDVGLHNIFTIMVDSAAEVNGRPLDSARDAPDEAWVSIDLSSGLSRPLTGDDAWIGMALDQVPAGNHVFRGVPFTVAAHPEWGAAGIGLRSARMQHSRGADVPSVVDVTVPPARLSNLYVLHVAGYLLEHQPVARYTILYQDGSRESFDVVGFGEGSDDGSTMDRMALDSHIQDWWPTHFHFENDRIKPAMVLHEGNPSKTLRYLYVLDLPNPRPEAPVSGVTFESLHPEEDASVMVLAVTGRKAETEQPTEQQLRSP